MLTKLAVCNHRIVNTIFIQKFCFREKIIDVLGLSKEKTTYRNFFDFYAKKIFRSSQILECKYGMNKDDKLMN